MADIRSLKIALLADVKDFIGGLDDAKKSSNSFSDGLGNALKTAGAAFVGLASAAGTAAVAIGIDGVKAAIEAQKEDALLEQSIKNLTGATALQTKATFEYLDAAEDAAGVNADQLKPSFERILRSVKDLTKTQNILDVAQDVAAGTGKSLTEVADSLARAYDGNVKGLKDLGIELETTIRTTKKVKVSKGDLTKAELSSKSAALGLQAAQERLNKVLANSKSDALDVAQAQNALERAQLRAGDASDAFEKKQKNVGKAITETKDVARPFADILSDLSKQYEGAAAKAAETYAGKIEILKTSLQKMKEEIGFVLLDALDPLIKFITTTGVDALKDFVAGLTGGTPQSVKTALKDAKGRVIEFKDSLYETAGNDRTGAYGLGIAIKELAKELANLNETAFGITGAESGLKKLLDLLTDITTGIENAIKSYQRFRDTTIGGALLDISAAVNPAALGGRLISGESLLQAPRTANNININISGAIDPQATAKNITKVLGTASKTTGVKVPASALRVGLR